MSRRALSRVPAGLLVLLAAAGFPPAHADPTKPFVLYGDESVASTDDARAFFVNPAGLGWRYPSEFLFAYADRQQGAGRTTGAATWRRVAFGLTHQAGVDETYGLGFSLGDRRASLGWVTNRRDDLAGSRERDYDSSVGWLSRPSPWLSTGATVAHLFQPDIRGNRVRRDYTLALGFRPAALDASRAYDAGFRWTLTADAAKEEGAAWDQTRLKFGTTIEPVNGFVIALSFDSQRAYQMGFTFRGLNAAAHATGQVADVHHSPDPERNYGIYAFSAHEGEDRPLIAPDRAKRVAVVRVQAALTDEDLPSGLTGGGGTPSAPIHRQLERALEDPLTRGVFLELGGAGGMAQLEELRPRIAKLEQAGKPVVAYMAYGGTRGDLYLSSAAARVYVSPAAEFMGLGLRSERRYYRKALERFGIRFDRASIGEFKSAYRNYSVDSTPPADTVVLQRMLTQRQALFVNTLSTGRAVAPEKFAHILDGRPYTPAALMHAGLVDSVLWREEALADLGRLTGLGKKPRTVDLGKVEQARVAWQVPARIAVVYASGPIVNGRSAREALDGGVMGDATIVAQLEQACRAPGVRAVVLRIESPGGSAAASYMMDHAVERLRQETGKPIVVSMGSVAASGGYFMALHADKIYADKYTVTGSIGVVFVKPSLEGAYAKLGVRQDDFERGEYMRGLSYARDWRAREQQAADSSIRRTYRTFVDRVRDGRKLEPVEANAYAQGRAWMGEDAAERKLIDGIGGLEAAIGEARRLGGVPADEKITLLEFRRPLGSWFERLTSNLVRAQVDGMLRMPDTDVVQARADDWLEEMAE
jgi:protease-4